MRPDGSLRVVWGEFGELKRDSGGNPEVLTGVIQDITERKAAEEILRRSADELEEIVRQRTAEIKKRDDVLRRAQKIEALGTLAGGIAHDFNNVLATIMINAELTLLETGDREPETEASVPLAPGRPPGPGARQADHHRQPAEGTGAPSPSGSPPSSRTP